MLRRVHWNRHIALNYYSRVAFGHYIKSHVPTRWIFPGQIIMSLLTLLVNNARRRILNIEKRDHAWIPHNFALACIIVNHARWEKPDHALLTILHGTRMGRVTSRLAGDTHKHACTWCTKKPNRKQSLFLLIKRNVLIELSLHVIKCYHVTLRNLIEFKAAVTSYGHARSWS